MNNTEYERSILLKNDMIIIDTSAVMDYEGLQRLVDNIEVWLMEMKKKIHVPKVVWMELMRHLNSSNYDKQEKATHAIDIICMRSNIFSIKDTYVDHEDMMKAFADAELLSELTKNKSRYGQLLITNDKKLSKDAFELNKQESCKGSDCGLLYFQHRMPEHV